MHEADREHDEKWRFRRPFYDDFGISADEVESIIHAHEKMQEQGEFSYSEEVQEKEKRYFKRRLVADKVSLIITWVIIGLIAFGCIYHFTGGLNKKALHAALYFYIILCAGGFIVLPFAYSIINRPIESIIDLFIKKDGTIEEKKKSEEREYRNMLKMAQKYDDLCKYEKAYEEYEYWQKVNKGVQKENPDNELRRAVRGLLEEKGYKDIIIDPFPNVEFEAVYNCDKYAICSKSSGKTVSENEMKLFAETINLSDIDKGLFFSLVGFSDEALKFVKDNELQITCVGREELIDQSW